LGEIETSYNIEMNSVATESYYDINSLSNYYGTTMGHLQEIIKYPMLYNAILREISLQAYNTNGMYARAIEIRTSLPVLTFLAVGGKGNLSKKEKISNLMRSIGHEKTTRDILKRLGIFGTYVGVLIDKRDGTVVKSGTPEDVRDDGVSPTIAGKNTMFFPLDLDYCKIQGVQNNAQIALFNLSYFDQFKSNQILSAIEDYPKYIKTAYLQYREFKGSPWIVLNPKETIVLTAQNTLNEPWGRPWGLQAFPDMKLQSDYMSNQYKIINEVASSIYYMILPEGQIKGSCALNKDQQVNQIAAFKKAVKNTANSMTSNVSAVSFAPNTEIGKLEKDASLLRDTLSDENIKRISTSLGFASSLLNASSEGSSGFAGMQANLDVISKQMIDLVSLVSMEYTRILNHYIGNDENPIQILYTPITSVNQERLFSRAKELYTLSGGSRSMMIACAGFDPDLYFKLCDEEIEQKYDEKYQPHITSYTATDNADNKNADGNLGGRPSKNEDDLSFKGQITKVTGANDNIKPSTQ
jgi:hypothetical protein